MRARRARPRVGITIGSSRQGKDFFAIRDDYVRAVEAAGGLPLVLVPGTARDAADLLDALDALVLTGGDDVDPRLYGEEPHPTVKEVRRDRDEFELALCREGLRRDHPILAICRGHQVLNVATGGTLVQDIPSQVTGAGRHDPDVERWGLAHEVRVERGSRLHQILGRDTVAVNSFHHQAVKQLGAGLQATAWSEGDGVVEGIESTAHRFVVGVQWHPEAFWDQPTTFQPLFEAVVEAGRIR